MAALEGNKDDRHVGQGWGSWPGTLAGLGILPQALHAPPTLVWVPAYHTTHTVCLLYRATGPCPRKPKEAIT